MIRVELQKVSAQLDAGKITARKALQIMKAFLNSYYLRGLALSQASKVDEDLTLNDIRDLLENLKENEHGELLNQKVWLAWLVTVDEIAPEFSENQQLTILQVFYISKRFLENYCEQMFADDVSILLYQMNIINEWMDSVSLIMNGHFSNRH